MSLKRSSLKCGIEIHQQLEGKKLFCGCPTALRDDLPNFTIKRKLRAVAGEGGKVDIAAEQEQWKGKTFIYEGYSDTTCLVETDSEPPHELNKEALYTVLQFCQLVKAEVIPVVQVMRKTIVDGSNTSGFQRTALIARGGEIGTTEGEVRIENISLEEDAARIISEAAAEKVYRLDRLGIPLIEIGTAPDIKSPEQCQEAAKKIGMLLRSLPGVKRGLGTIRQDLNVSIEGGSRIEIKGAQDLKQLPLLVELEAKRQGELLKIKRELKNTRGDKLNIVDASSLLGGSSSQIVQKTLLQKGKILAIKLPGFAGYLGRELQPKYRLGTELSERAKILAGVGGIIHSDELPNYGIMRPEVEAIQKELKCTPKDAFVLVADVESRARRALEAVHQRVREVLTGIPPEVRKAKADGTTSFLRPIPGAARLYPETDVPLTRPSLKGITVPESLEVKIGRYQKVFGLSQDLAEFVAKSERRLLFEELVARYSLVKPAFIAETLTSTPLDIKRQFQQDPERLSDGHFRELFRLLWQGKIHKDIVIDVLIDMIKGTFELKNYAALGTEKIHAQLKEIIREHPRAPFSALMGLAMKRLQGKASGKFISEALRNLLGQGHK